MARLERFIAGPDDPLPGEDDWARIDWETITKHAQQLARFGADGEYVADSDPGDCSDGFDALMTTEVPASDTLTFRRKAWNELSEMRRRDICETVLGPMLVQVRNEPWRLFHGPDGMIERVLTAVLDS